MRWPVTSRNITQQFNDPCCRASYAKFGMVGHNGLDFGIGIGTPVYSAVSGSVSSGFEAGGYGNYIFVTGEGYQTVYGHLNQIVRANGNVNAGDLIGYSGNTGNSTGPHLHFGTRPVAYNRNNGFFGYIDPLPLLNNQGASNVDKIATVQFIKDASQNVLLRDVPMSDDEINKYHLGKTEEQIYTEFWHAPESSNRRLFLWNEVPKLQKLVDELKSNPTKADLQAIADQLSQATAQIQADKEKIAELEANSDTQNTISIKRNFIMELFDSVRDFFNKKKG